jgi:hypothetical protein
MVFCNINIFEIFLPVSPMVLELSQYAQTITESTQQYFRDKAAKEEQADKLRKKLLKKSILREKAFLALAHDELTSKF